MIKGLQKQNNIAKESKEFLLNLLRVNVHQLKANKLNNPEHAILEEMEKEEEIMGSLLEREMERARNIRRKEKLKERAKLALLGKLANEDEDGEYIHSGADAGEIPESDYESVPDSESGSDIDDESSQSDDENDINEVDNDTNIEVKRKSRLVISDDEENEEELSQTINELQRSDDSYMFGSRNEEGNDDSLGLDRDQLITTVTSQEIKKVFGEGASLTQAFNTGSPVSNQTNNTVPFANNESTIDQTEELNEQFSTARSDEYQLFQNLQPRTANSQTSQTSEMNLSFVHTKKIPSFRDISEANTQESTPPDSTQIDYPTEIDAITQILSKEIDEEEDDDDITPFSVRRGRKKMIELSTTQEAEAVNDENDKSTEEDQENMKAQIKMYEDKIRRKELKMRKKRKELERKGIKNMVDGEAEESEDEWKGIGGVDGEVSDQANSEDEKMIDNNLFIDLKNDEIRNKFMQEYQIKDQKELEKLLDDIKNHRLSKRAAANDLDIELSDEDDELLLAYRRQKLKEQQERLLQNKKIQALSKDERAKAFFASIQDEDSVIKIDDDEDEDEDNASVQELASASKSTEGEEQSGEDEDSLDKEAPVKPILKIGEAFVHKQLSFLTNANDDYDNLQRMSRFQHGFESSDEEVEDIKSLKLKCLSNLTSKRSEDSGVTSDLSRKRFRESGDTDVDEDGEDDDDDDEFMPSFKKPSVVKSFKSFQEQQGVLIKDGKKHFSGVTISNQYKQVAGSKASISFLQRKKQAKQVKSLKEKQIEQSINNSKLNSRLFSNNGFD